MIIIVVAVVIVIVIVIVIVRPGRGPRRAARGTPGPIHKSMYICVYIYIYIYITGYQSYIYIYIHIHIYMHIYMYIGLHQCLQGLINYIVIMRYKYSTYNMCIRVVWVRNCIYDYTFQLQGLITICSYCIKLLGTILLSL